MEWSFANIDWGATLWLALIPPLLLAGMTLDVLHQWRRAGWTVHLIILASVIAAAALLVTISERATDGPFGQTTAAWVQGVGSVLAIVLAVWIDQGSARRQSAILNAERERQTADREAALDARRQALLECQAALALIDRDLNRLEDNGRLEAPPLRLSDFALRRLTSAQLAVSYYLMIPAGIPHNMVSALAGASQLVHEFDFDEGPLILGVARLTDLRKRAATAREQMRYILAVMDFDFLEELTEGQEP